VIKSVLSENSRGAEQAKHEALAHCRTGACDISWQHGQGNNEVGNIAKHPAIVFSRRVCRGVYPSFRLSLARPSAVADPVGAECRLRLIRPMGGRFHGHAPPSSMKAARTEENTNGWKKFIRAGRVTGPRSPK